MAGFQRISYRKGDERQIRCLQDPLRNSEISWIKKALEALGKRLIVGYHAA
jgi:hypothetical protein